MKAAPDAPPAGAHDVGGPGRGRGGPAVAWLVTGAVLAGSVAAFDLAFAGALPVLDEGAPLDSPPFLARSVLLAAGAAAWVLGIHRAAFAPLTRRTPTGFGARSAVVSRPAPPGLAAAANAGGTVVLALLLWWPAAFTRFALEDGPAEDVTAALLIAGALVLAVRAARLAPRAPRGAAVVLAVLAIGYFVLGMEEISWGQRLIGFEPPAALAGNMQGEANLHNLATNTLELLFYTGTTLAFVIVPLAQRGTGVLDRWPALAALTPSVTLLLAFAPATALNYDMWNVSPIQFGFWVTCATLAYLCVPASRIALDRPGRVVAALTLVLCVATQAALLLNGGRTGRPWDATEYRELFTVAAMAWYALSLRGAMHPDDPPGTPAPATADRRRVGVGRRRP